MRTVVGLLDTPWERTGQPKPEGAVAVLSAAAFAVMEVSSANPANQQAACCIPRCADVADPINTPCTCAQNQYQDNDQCM